MATHRYVGQLRSRIVLIDFGGEVTVEDSRHPLKRAAAPGHDTIFFAELLHVIAVLVGRGIEPWSPKESVVKILVHLGAVNVPPGVMDPLRRS